MIKKYLFMLGAGFMQKPAIEAAKKLGCYITVADGNSKAYCKPLCDEFIQIDLKDTDALCNYALGLKEKNMLDAVFTSGTDFSAACAKIAEVCSLKGHSYEAALNASDKIRMRSCFKKEGVPSPLFFEIGAKSDKYKDSKKLMNLIEEKGFGKKPFPLVIKPVDNMGSRGCKMINSIEDLHDSLQSALQYSRSNRAILEQYMDGPEFSIDSLVYKGKVTITGFADRHIYYPPYFIEMGHTLPSSLSEQDKQRVISVFKQGIKALGLSCGAAKGDIKLTKNGPMIGEIAARLSGGYMSGWTYPYASEINLTEQALRIALGEEPSVILDGNSLEPSMVSAERAWVSIPGIISSTEGYTQIHKIPFVKDIFPRIYEGDSVTFPINNVEKCGNVISCAHHRKEAVCSAEDAVKEIIFRLQPNNVQTTNFLKENIDCKFPPSAFFVKAREFEMFLTNLSSSTITAQDICTHKEKILPPFLLKNDIMDWNHKSPSFVLKQFCAIAHKEKYFDNKSVECQLFWHYFIRGSLQGILYLFDKK